MRRIGSIRRCRAAYLAGFVLSISAMASSKSLLLSLADGPSPRMGSAALRGAEQLMPAFRHLAAELLAHQDREMLIAATASPAGHLLSFIELHGERVRATLLEADRIAALSHPASALLALAHSHPSGIAEPSAFDLAATRRIACFAKIAGIQMVDHLIYARSDCFSFAEAGLL